MITDASCRSVSRDDALSCWNWTTNERRRQPMTCGSTLCIRWTDGLDDSCAAAMSRVDHTHTHTHTSSRLCDHLHRVQWCDCRRPQSEAEPVKCACAVGKHGPNYRPALARAVQPHCRSLLTSAMAEVRHSFLLRHRPRTYTPVPVSKSRACTSPAYRAHVRTVWLRATKFGMSPSRRCDGFLRGSLESIPGWIGNRSHQNIEWH